MSKPFIGIKKLYYGKPMTTAPTLATLDLSKDFTEVKNIHQDTWGYEQADPNIEDYTNELDGKLYYRDPTSAGTKTISFTIGSYDANVKEDLCGGTASEDGTSWSAPDEIPMIEKSIVAITKSGNTIVFTRAFVTGKNAAASKNIGLGVTATAMDNSNEGVSDEYMFWGEPTTKA